ncbi:MAG: radical SAM protein [Thermodesulfobacteriota bacterium]
MVLTIKEIECKSILNRSGLADYALNPYVGCEHGCRYCYGRFMMRYTKHREPWGRFVDVKVNGPRVLIKQVKRFPTGRVFISSVCDGWQPLEEKYGITRACVEILLANGFPITILTKSALASRDFDLIEGRPEVELGATLTTLDERWRRLFEPRGSPSEERVSLLKQAKEKGITTYAFLGPIMPYLFDTEENLRGLIGAFRDVGVDWIYVDLLNPRPGVWASLYPVLRDHHPHLVPRYKEVLFNPRVRNDYGVRLREKIEKLGRLYRLEKKLQFLW